MTRRSGVAARGAGVLLVPLLLLGSLAGPSLAETEVGSAVVSGEIEAGGRVITGDFGSAKFDEYRSNRPGGYVLGWQLIENEDRTRYIRSEIEFWDEDEQRYLLGLGRYGHYGLEFEYEEFPSNNVGKENVRTPYSRGFDGKLFLPPAWDYSNAATGDLQGELDANVVPRKLGFRQINGSANGFVRPQLGLEFTAGYDIQDKRGTRADSIMWGFTNFASFAEPVDERIHQISAGGSYAGEQYTVGLAYLGSIYDNEISSDIVDNPLCAGDGCDGDGTPPGGTQPGRGRQSVAPDNSAHQITLTGSAVVPTSFPSRVLGTLSYGIRLQDDNFLPYTINSTLVTGPLPRSSLDGEVHTTLLNLLYTARPADDWNVDVRYRLYNLDNDSRTVEFTEQVPDDTEVDPGACTDDGRSKYCSAATAYRRQNADLNASWRATDTATVFFGFGWENWKRSKDREVRHSNEYGGEVGLDFRPMDRVQLRTAYNLGVREYNEYFTKSSENPALRRFDEAKRLRNAFDWRALYLAREEVTFSVSGGVTHDDYFDSKLGLRRSLRWNIGFDAEYVPTEWLAVATWYVYDQASEKQRNPSSGGYTTKNRDTAHTVGIDLGVELVTGVLEWDSLYALQIATANTDTDTNPSFPKLRDNLHNLETKLTWHVLDPLDLIAGYRFAKFDSRNFYTDELGTATGSNVYLNNRLDDYAAHVFTLGARYEF